MDRLPFFHLLYKPTEYSLLKHLPFPKLRQTHLAKRKAKNNTSNRFQFQAPLMDSKKLLCFSLLCFSLLPGSSPLSLSKNPPFALSLSLKSFFGFFFGRRIIWGGSGFCRRRPPSSPPRAAERPESWRRGAVGFES